MSKSKIFVVLLAVLMLFSASACGSSEPDMEVLKVGVKSDVLGFGELDITTNEYKGFEIALAKLIAKELTGDENKIEFTTVTTNTRGVLLDNGDIDLVIATFTVTEERKLSYNFSTVYYTDAVGLLVKKDSGIKDLKDLDGKVVGVNMAATSKEAILEALAENEELKDIKVTFKEFTSYSDIQAALGNGQVDVFSVDKSILRIYMDQSTEILPVNLKRQPYGIASKLDNKELAEKVDKLIVKWLEDGTIKKLTEEYGINID